MPQLWRMGTCGLVCHGAPAWAQWEGKGQLWGSLCVQSWRLRSPGCCWMLPSHAGFLCSVVKQQAQAKGTLRCGPPKGAPGCPGCRVWCPRRASSEPRFWGLLCRAAGLVLSCVRAPPCPCSGEYQKCVRCPGAPRATRRAAVSPPAHPPRSSNPSTRHLQVGLAAGAARGSQTEPKQKEGVEMPLCKLGCKRG